MKEPHIDPSALLADIGWVQRLARSLLQDEALAADLAQDVLTVAIERPPAYEGTRRQLRSWLGGVTRKLAMRGKRERAERPLREMHAARPEASEAEVQADARLRLHDQLTHAVMALAEPYRSTVVLRFFENIPPREIAKRKGIPAATVRKHLERGLEQLRARLDREHTDRRAWCGALASLARTGATPAKIAAGTALGILIMNKFVVAGLTALVLGLGFWTFQGSAPASEATSPGKSPVTQSLAAEDVPKQNSEEARELQRERVAVAEPAPLAALVLEVADEFGVPIANAKVRCLPEGGELEKGETDRNGEASFAPTDRPGIFLVVANGYLPVAPRVNFMVGRQHITLNRGSELQGWLRVDGQVPIDPVRLALNFNETEFAGSLPEILSKDAVADLYPHTTTETELAGEFRLQGLPESWSGSLHLPQQYIFHDGEITVARRGGLLVRGPATGLRLDATRVPTISGQFVWQEDGRGVDYASVTVSAQFSDGRESPSLSGSVDDEGRFRIGVLPRIFSMRLEDIAPLAFARIRVSVNAPAARKIGPLVFESQGQLETGDIGVIRLEKAEKRELRFRVENREGEAIEDAYVLGEELSDPTNKDGYGILDPPLQRPFTWLAGARGYRIEKLAPSAGVGTEEDPLVFILNKGNLLEIHALDPNGNPPAGATLNLATKGRLFDGSDRWNMSKVHRSILGLRNGLGESWGSGSLEAHLPIDGSAKTSLASLFPHKAIHLEVRSRLGQVLAQRDFTGPGPEESMRIDISVEKLPTTLAGQVLDENGIPLPNVGVSLERTGVRIGVRVGAKERRTGVDGRFTFENIHATETPLTLTADHQDYEGYRHEGILVEGDGAPLEVRLTRGHELKIRVVDSKGVAVPVRRVMVDLPEPRPKGRAVDIGVFLFSGLPAGMQRFTCWIGGRQFELHHDPLVSETTFVVPRPGSLEVSTQRELAVGESILQAQILSADKTEVIAALHLREAFGIWKAGSLLLPGTYHAQLQSRGSDGLGWQQIGPAKRFEIAAGKLSVIDFGAR